MYKIKNKQIMVNYLKKIKRIFYKRKTNTEINTENLRKENKSDFLRWEIIMNCMKIGMRELKC